MRRSSVIRGGLLAAASLALAALAGAQAASNAYAKSAPQLVADLSPFAGTAKSRLAQSKLKPPSKGENPLDIDTTAARPYAFAAVKADPLNPSALTILALGQDGSRRSTTLRAASALNKRSSLLQGVLLSEYQRRGDLAGTLAVLQQTLRVHPGVSRQIIPLLAELLGRDGAVQVFQSMLKRDPEWLNSFLSEAARLPEALKNLARLRLGLGNTPDVSLETDRTILRQLLDAGQVEPALAIYRIRQKADRPAGDAIYWSADLPPIDWQLTDEGGIYARVKEPSEPLTIAIRPGYGGILAQRVVELGSGAKALRVQPDVTPSDTRAALHMKVLCLPSGTAAVDTDLRSGPTDLLLPSKQLDCPAYQITLTGRAWSDGGRVEATFPPIGIVR